MSKIEDNTATASTALPNDFIGIPREEPMRVREWLQGAAEIVLLVTVVLPIWTALGIALITPATLLKNYINVFPPEYRKWIDRIYAFTTEIFDILAGAAKYARAYFGPPLKNVKPGGKPILLVHGYLHNATAWLYFLNRLGREKDLSIHTISLSHPFHSLEEYADEVAKKIDEIYDDKVNNPNQEPVTLGAHSMGGPISVLAALQSGKKVDHVFTFGSPFDGSPLAAVLGFGPNARQMRPGSPILEFIKTRMKNAEFEIHSAGSDADLIVPADSALSGPVRDTRRYSDLSHMHFLVSDTMIDWILSVIRSPATAL